MLGPALDIYNQQSLCISIPETLLHVTLKRRAEISADIFARLLRYFFLSCKNLTITQRTRHQLVHTEVPKMHNKHLIFLTFAIFDSPQHQLVHTGVLKIHHRHSIFQTLAIFDSFR